MSCSSAAMRTARQSSAVAGASSPSSSSAESARRVRVVGTQRVLESGVSRPRIDQKAVTDLADVAKTLNGGSVECEERGSVEPDVIPERVADDFRGG